MRTWIVLLVAGLALVAGGSTYAAALDNSSAYVEQQQPAPGKDIDISVDLDRGGDGAWYASPLWIAIGVIALVVLVLLIVLATRGGTTVVRD